MEDDFAKLREGLRGFLSCFVEYVGHVIYTIRSTGLGSLWSFREDLPSFYSEMSSLFRKLTDFAESYIRTVGKFLVLFYELSQVIGVSDMQELFSKKSYSVNVDCDFLKYHVKYTIDLLLPPVDEHFLNTMKKMSVLARAQRLLKSETVKKFKEEIYLQAAEWLKIRKVLYDLYVKALDGKLTIDDYMRTLQQIRSAAKEASIRLSLISGLNAGKYLLMDPESIIEEFAVFADDVTKFFENEQRFYFALLNVLNYVVRALWGREKGGTFTKIVRGEADVEVLIPETLQVDEIGFAAGMAKLELEQVWDSLYESKQLAQSLLLVAEVLRSEELKKIYGYYVNAISVRERYWDLLWKHLTRLQELVGHLSINTGSVKSII
ncbi:MAG: hypothetical protein QXK43_06640 [Candidatus Jordarchaeales archaeon]